ncbi:hypothetical protein BASA81_015161 [Batrachochytrium salamandrivorans]|nr:hypothetical protein BASA81_015161 [Batrachochytrium salamandrivorans]
MPKTSCAYKAELAIAFLEFVWGVAIVSFTISGDSRRGKRNALYCSITLVLLCLVLQIVSTVYFQQAVNLVIRQNSVVSGALTDEKQIYYDNAVLSSFTACCDGCHAPSNNCTNAAAYYKNTANPFCGNGTCTSVQVCTSPSQDGCFSDLQQQLYPPIQIDQNLCQFFEQALLMNKSRGSGSIVGYAVNGSCGGGNPNQYSWDVLEYLAWYYSWALNGLTALCVVQAISLLAGLCLCQHVAGGRFAQAPPKATPTTFQVTNEF